MLFIDILMMIYIFLLDLLSMCCELKVCFCLLGLRGLSVYGCMLRRIFYRIVSVVVSVTLSALVFWFG